jgi:hypothetical protein
MIRRAIYLERGRRLEEMEKRPDRWGIASSMLWLGFLLLWLVIYRGPFYDGYNGKPIPRHPPLVDFVLLFGGSLAFVVAYRTLGIPRRPKRAPDAVVSIWKTDLFGSPSDPANWRFPRWLDQLGSWLLARVERDGWRIRLKRDTPPGGTAELTPGALQDPLKRIRAAVRRGVSGADRARETAEELAAEGKALLRQLEPLLGRLARLHDGVLASRTIGLGGSLESELDRVEAEADGLRSRAVECARLLEALAASLERSDAAGTRAILERARALASEVRRLSQAT